MPSVSLQIPSLATSGPVKSALPSLLQTPNGLAILEIQGTVHAPSPESTGDLGETQDSSSQTLIGHIDFPEYVPDSEDQKWMKRVYLYVGEHQRLVGELKKLSKPIAVIKKRDVLDTGPNGSSAAMGSAEALEVLEVVKWKLMFQGRPEPV
jgi:chromosome transmission fidelity protein 8